MDNKRKLLFFTILLKEFLLKKISIKKRNKFSQFSLSMMKEWIKEFGHVKKEKFGLLTYGTILVYTKLDGKRISKRPDLPLNILRTWCGLSLQRKIHVPGKQFL